MRKLLPFASLLLIATLLAPGTVAQIDVEIHRLEIRDGRVFHDGKEIPASTLPEDFDAEGLSFTFEYSGPVMPAITLNGRVYALEGERLVLLDEAAEDGSRARAVAMMPAEGSSPYERRRQFEEAYLQSLSESDRALYERLMLERDMEEEILRIAYAARNASDAADRERLRAELRRQLGAMFDLKLQNRQEEIRQVEELLELMHHQTEEREARRDELIDRRVAELLGEN